MFLKKNYQIKAQQSPKKDNEKWQKNQRVTILTQNCNSWNKWWKKKIEKNCNLKISIIKKWN